ncbi:hypothetical protein [Paenibacillus chibensis]|nr:hypothetical protein [Paenibacillus chibensis]
MTKSKASLRLILMLTRFNTENFLHGYIEGFTIYNYDRRVAV